MQNNDGLTLLTVTKHMLKMAGAIHFFHVEFLKN